MYVCCYATVHTWTLENNFVEVVVSYIYKGPRD